MGGRAWTEREDAVIRECASFGAGKIARQLKEQCGSRRTKSAVQRRASRIGVSLFKHAACPRCGRWSRWTDPITGFCATCNALQSAEPANAQRAEIARKTLITEEDAAATVEARRYAAKMRKRKCRDRGYV